MVKVSLEMCLFCVVHDYTKWMLLQCIMHTACRFYWEYHTGFTSNLLLSTRIYFVSWRQLYWTWSFTSSDSQKKNKKKRASPSRQTSESSHVFFWFECALGAGLAVAGCFHELLCSPLCLYAGANPSRPGGFPGANSPGPVADLYAPSSQDSAVGNYISAASPQPGSGFGPSITVSLLHWLWSRLNATWASFPRR